MYLKETQEDIEDFKQKVSEYGKITGQFMSNINDDNVIDLYEKSLHGYVSSLWKLVNN